MAIPHQALVLVTDGRKLLFLRNQGDESRIDLRTEAHDERADLKDREIKTDGPGLSKQSWGYGAPALGETDFHEQEKTRWAKRVAEKLNSRALAKDYEALAIVAPPRTLAELRKHLHKEAERRLVATFNKEMTDRPVDQIEDLLVGEGAPPA
jgi:protein required for attachment to host cells